MKIGIYTMIFGNTSIPSYTSLDFAMTNGSFDGATITASVKDTDVFYRSGSYAYSQALTISASRNGAEVPNSGVSLGFNPGTETWQQINVDEKSNIVEGEFMSTDYFSYGMRAMEWTVAAKVDGFADGSYDVGVGWNIGSGYMNQGKLVNSSLSYLTIVMGYSYDQVDAWNSNEIELKLNDSF